MMAYNVKELEKKALKAIEDNKLFFIEDVVSYLPCNKGTFYNLKLHELNTLKEALEKNKVEIKVSLRQRWYKSEAPALQIALYKLIGTDEESDRINSQKIKAEVNELTQKVQTVYDELQQKPAIPESEV